MCNIECSLSNKENTFESILGNWIFNYVIKMKLGLSTKYQIHCGFNLCIQRILINETTKVFVILNATKCKRKSIVQGHILSGKQ